MPTLRQGRSRGRPGLPYAADHGNVSRIARMEATLIGTAHKGAVGRTATYPLDALTEQGQVAMGTDRAREPQARLDHHRQRHPDEAWVWTRIASAWTCPGPGAARPDAPARLASGGRRASHATTVRSSNPQQATTIACSGPPCARSVSTSATVSTGVRRRSTTVPFVVAKVLWHSVQMHRLSLREWIPILPWPLCPLVGHARLGQNVVVGS